MTSVVNENHTATIRVSNGYTIDAAGKQVPFYESFERKLQLQSMSSADLDHFGFANQQGLFMFAYGDDFFEIIDRPNQTGNAMIETVKYGDPTIYVWQVVKNVEPWFKWSKAVLQLVEKKLP